jgi:hypothetical protein
VYAYNLNHEKNLNHKISPPNKNSINLESRDYVESVNLTEIEIGNGEMSTILNFVTNEHMFL